MAKTSALLIQVNGTSGCIFAPGLDKDVRKDAICNQVAALREILKEWGVLYSAADLKEACCTAVDPTTRDAICPAVRSLAEHGRSSSWRK